MTAPFWRPFVPRPVASRLAAGEDPRTLSHRGPGAVLFADVSGFTAFAEALSSRGPSGAELLHRALADAFTPLVRKIGRAGGWVAKFGGDAMTAVFDGPDAFAVAAATALELQRGVARAAEGPPSIPEVAGHRLGLKIGVAGGEVRWCVAGDPARRLELLLWGEALDAAVAAEHAASRGQVVAASAGPAFEGEPRPDGRFLLLGAPTPPRAPVRPPISGDAAAGAVFLHPVVAERVRSGHLRFVQEHRRVAVVFVRFPSEGGERALRATVESLIDTATAFGGHLDKVDLADKGHTALVVFGAPVSHEDDGLRALRFALAVSRAHGAAAGVHVGVVHAGVFGAPERREYTVLGDAVNLAARLLQAAPPGTVLASAEVVAPDARRLETGPATELTVKGRARPVVAMAVLGLRRAGLLRERSATPFVGRQTERARALRALAAAKTGRGRALVITGDAGIGKSRLLEEVLTEAEGMGFAVTGATAASHAQEPWEAWREVWRELLPWSPGEDPSTIRARLRAIEPAHEVRAPLLAGVLGARIPPNPAIEALADESRVRAVYEVLGSVLGAAAGRSPRVIALDDAQWLDGPSQALVPWLAAAIQHLPVLLVVASRPQPWVTVLARRPGVDRVALEPLPPDEARALARLHLGDIDPDAFDGLLDDTGGNPFFVEEMARWALAHAPDDPAPRTLTALVQARLDALSEAEQLTVKAASVIGRRFRLGWLRACCPELGDAGGVTQHLRHLERLEILPADDAADCWRFRHALTRETAYATLTDAVRRELHERVARTLASDGAEPTQIAWHYAHTDDTAAQTTWFRRAGEAAAAAYDPDGAVHWFERWLGLGEADGRAVVLHELGRIAFRAGNLSVAETRLSAALGAAEGGGETLEAAAVRVSLATLLADTGRREAALDAARGALQALSEDHSAARVSALLCAASLLRETDPDTAADRARDAFDLAQALDVRWSAGRAAAVVAAVLLRSRDDVPRAEPWLDRAQALAEAAEDPIALARVASTRAVACWWTGRAREATAAWGRTIRELGRLGDAAQAWTVYGNLAQVHLNRRSVVTARPMQALRCDHDTRTGRWAVAASGLPSLLQTAYFHPDLAELAADHAPLVLDIARAAASPYWLGIALASAALIRWRTGRDHEALEVARECLRLQADGLVDEAQGWAACWGQLAGQRLGTWTADDDALVAAARATAREGTRGYFAAADAIARRDVDDALRVLDRACKDQGDVFLHAIREVCWGRPMDAPPALEPPPDMGRVPPQWPELFAAIRERWVQSSRLAER